MTEKEHMEYCAARIKMFTEMMERCYPEPKNKQPH